MENATKALLIAAAVLIAIILISLGLAVVRQGQEAVKDADLSEAEATAFNNKFTVYEGTNVATSNVNAMLNAVFAHNNQEAAAGTNNYVSVVTTGTATSTNLPAATTSSVTRVSGNNYYSVQCQYKNGLVNSIQITKK